MSNTRVERIKGTMLLRSRYKCRHCQCERWGTGFEMLVDAASPEALAEAVKRIHPSPHDMPVGWASFGAQSYQCTRCNEKAR